MGSSTAHTRLRSAALALVLIGLAVPAFAQPQAPRAPAAVVSYPSSAVSSAGATLIPIKFPDGTAAAPSITFTNAPNWGLYRDAGLGPVFTVAGTAVASFAGDGISFGPSGAINWYATAVGSGTHDLIWLRDAANTGAQRNGTTAQQFNIYNTYTSSTNFERLNIGYNVTNSAGSGTIGANVAGFIVGGGSGGGTQRQLYIDGSIISWLTGGSVRWNVSASGHLTAQTDKTYTIGASGATRPLSYFASFITPAASVAAGGTTNTDSDITRTRYQVTVAPATGDCSTAFIAAALTADCTIATLPAGQKLVGVYADVTAGFTCSGTCTGTKTMMAGKTAGGVEILATGLNVAITATYGLADADLGSGMTRAGAIQGGYLNSWSSTTPVIVRFTSGTGFWGSGAATFVNAGSVKFTLITEQVK